MLRYLLSSVLALIATAELAAAQCEMTAADAAWVKRALDAWDLSLRDTLHVAKGKEPLVTVVFDATCVYRGTNEVAKRGEPHGGAIHLPDGKTLPPQVTSFAAPYDDN